jgi:hypothetical protein
VSRLRIWGIHFAGAPLKIVGAGKRIFTTRFAVYVIRTYGDVCAPSRGGPIPICSER